MTSARTVDGQRLVGTSEIARRLGMTSKSVSRWVREGEFGPFVTTPGGHRRIRVAQLEAWMNQHGYDDREQVAP